MAVATSASANSPSSRASWAWKTIWKRRSPSSSQSGPPGAALADPVHLVEHLVGLLDEVGTEGPDVLRAVPGTAALGAQCAHDLLQPLHGLSRASHVLLDPALAIDPTCWVPAALAYHGLTRPNEMASLRAAPALLATLVVLASTGAAAQIEPPRPVEELAPDGPAQRPSRTRREPPPPAPEPEQEVPGTEAQAPARPPPPPGSPLDAEPAAGACARGPHRSVRGPGA